MVFITDKEDQSDSWKGISCVWMDGRDRQWFTVSPNDEGK